MDKAERKRLKQQGKQMVEERSQAVYDALNRANPVPINDPRWAKNYKEQTLRERKLRKDTPDHISSAEITERWEIITVDEDFQIGAPIAPAHFLQCPKCGDLVHGRPTQSVACGCGILGIDLDRKALCAPDNEKIALVKLIASTGSEKKSGVLGRLFGKRKG